ncbi:serine/threonine-protein kinase [Nocardiopsis valliformis]|uniref:serine/threonine-protein kinase n=1 Tax=Nocardiopsis valliformis TaxID=239974 RepID=UPI0003485508|nr:serine/threonine-protein kinase [Nocardiopsis valliformis]
MTTPLTSTDPEQIGPFTLAARIDSGGQGVVYLGHGEDGSPAAVKVLAGLWDDDQRQRERFARELSAARKVAPFCTAAVLAADMDADVPYIASEYVPGPTLRTAVTDEGPRTGAALDRLAIATITALAAVHEAGVVHRDLKPGNVILGPDGPRVIDFGIARFTDATHQTTAVTGTPAYMSPEQIRGDAAAASGDIFSWAAVMAYAASGRHAFPGETTVAVIDKVLSDPPDLTGVPDRLLPVLEHCLAKDPADRPTAVEVLDRLIGRVPAASKTEPTAVLEQASATVVQGTARIRVLPVAGYVPSQRGGAWGSTAPAPSEVSVKTPVAGIPAQTPPPLPPANTIPAQSQEPGGGTIHSGAFGGTGEEQTGAPWQTGDYPPTDNPASFARNPLPGRGSIAPDARGPFPDEGIGAARFRENAGTPWQTGDYPPTDSTAPNVRGTLPEEGTAGVGEQTGDYPPVGGTVPEVPPQPSPNPGRRSRARRRSKAGLLTVGAVAFLGLLGALLIWATGQGAPSQMEPARSVPATEPAEPVTEPEQGEEPEVREEEPAGGDGGGTEEPVEEEGVPTEWTPPETEWTPPEVDCHTDPHAPGCAPVEPDVCDYDPQACEPEGGGDGGHGGEGGGGGNGGGGGGGAGNGAGTDESGGDGGADPHPEGGAETE